MGGRESLRAKVKKKKKDKSTFKIQRDEYVNTSGASFELVLNSSQGDSTFVFRVFIAFAIRLQVTAAHSSANSCPLSYTLLLRLASHRSSQPLLLFLQRKMKSLKNAVDSFHRIGRYTLIFSPRFASGSAPTLPIILIAEVLVERSASDFVIFRWVNESVE